MNRARRDVEAEMDEVFRLVVLGMSDKEIMQARNLPKATLDDYMRRIRYRITARDMQISHEHILTHKEICRDRLLRDKRVFLQVMSNERSSDKIKVEAARADAEVNITLFKLENESALFVESIRKQQANVLHLDTIASSQLKILNDDGREHVEGAEPTPASESTANPI